jgi:hypothetical protein
MRLLDVADEIISVLASDPHASLNITLEINAEFPSGVADTPTRLRKVVSQDWRREHTIDPNVRSN